MYRAYGIQTAAVSQLNDLTGRCRLPWYAAHVEQRQSDAPLHNHLTVDANQVELEARHFARIAVVRDGFRVLIAAPSPLTTEALIHPVLGLAGAAIARWTGRTALHAASVVFGDVAWVLLAAPNGGKSTLASELDARGHRILSDDLTVLDHTTVLAGPRVCDLRSPAADQLERGRPTAEDRVGRRRHLLAPAPCESRLGGLIVLDWGERLDHRRATMAERLSALATHEALLEGPSEPTSFLDLMDTSMHVVTRPRSWDSLSTTCELLEQLGHV